MFERSVGADLASYGISLDSQVRIGRWSVDYQLSGTNILVEADGSYWHSKKHVQERDARKAASLIECGYELFRVDELDYYREGKELMIPIVRRWQEFTGKRAVHAVTGELFPG